MRSTLRKPGPPRNTNCVRSFSRDFFVKGDPFPLRLRVRPDSNHFCGGDGAMKDGAHLGRILKFDRVGIVPEINALTFS